MKSRYCVHPTLQAAEPITVTSSRPHRLQCFSVTGSPARCIHHYRLVSRLIMGQRLAPGRAPCVNTPALIWPIASADDGGLVYLIMRGFRYKTGFPFCLAARSGCSGYNRYIVVVVSIIIDRAPVAATARPPKPWSQKTGQTSEPQDFGDNFEPFN